VNTSFLNISIRAKFSLVISGLILISFFVVKTLLMFEVFDYSRVTNWYEYLSVIFFLPSFLNVVSEFLKKTKKEIAIKQSLDALLDESSLVSKADKFGKITYVNKKFEEVSGYTREELTGKDHAILNSGTHPKKFWTNMYKTTVKEGKIWNKIVTNRSKDGKEYIVNSWIMAHKDDRGQLKGFTSVRQDITELMNTLENIKQKDVYLEHAAKIIRHDMHSGINTYLPRGIKSLKRRLNEDTIKELRIQSPLQLIEDGLHHAQKVYSGVYEFTNLVKHNAQMSKTPCDIKFILEDYLRLTAYKNQVLLDDNLPKDLEVNEALFCTALDNLIRNGLKYNDSKTKWVKIYTENISHNQSAICIEDNGRGMSQKDFEHLSQPYTRKEGQKESGTGLGLNICIEILREHGFVITSQKLENGTKLTIKL
jgi:PAS domain S-box-containing protein